jgi:hypothetical protein
LDQDRLVYFWRTESDFVKHKTPRTILSSRGAKTKVMCFGTKPTTPKINVPDLSPFGDFDIDVEGI